jgi:hypothetical protein
MHEKDRKGNHERDKTAKIEALVFGAQRRVKMAHLLGVVKTLNVKSSNRRKRQEIATEKKKQRK